MSELRCRTCGTIWNGERHPVCPNCLAQRWGSTQGMIRAKHDPTKLPSAFPGFRSTLPYDLLERPDDYYRNIANSGTALYSTKHEKYCYVCGVPPSLNAGSAIPSGHVMPTRPLKAYLIADFSGPKAHIFPEDEARIQVHISGGELQLLPSCAMQDCGNLIVPGSKFCAKHSTPPQAE